ncbi:MAG: hypothetical protein IJD47_04000 [Clostridia bacterium]|nr:hypothetical protein [Clostridia bacterium]
MACDSMTERAKKRSGFFRFDTYFNFKTMLQLQPQKISQEHAIVYRL